ncbi:MAG: DUF1778 domain-containing protein [Synechococcaceae cyanobacterium]|nr:DUF1778 domain-containing protein [Synechococcaceae cyanobacterium]
MTSAKPQGHRPAKTGRIELRATEDDRNLLDRAAAALGTDRSSFLLSQGRLAAQRVLADREQFVLDADAQQEWERINSRPSRSLSGLARLPGAALALPHPSGGSAPGMSRTQPPELLATRHQLAGFRCRSAEQTAWLVEVAEQAHGTGTTRVFVVTEVDQSQVVADYAWCLANVAIADLPERLRRGAGRTPQPIALLARLGVDQRHEGQGLGAALLLDAITRVASGQGA